MLEDNPVLSLDLQNETLLLQKVTNGEVIRIYFLVRESSRSEKNKKGEDV